MAKPTIVLIPGAWHTPDHFQPFMQRLDKANYPTLSKQLPSVGALHPNLQSMASDADYIRQHILLPALDQGKELIVIMHSYGGVPGSAAAKGLSKQERSAAGLGGGVIGLVFVCAAIGYEDEPLAANAAFKLLTWCSFNDGTGNVDVAGDPADIFYTNVADKSLVQVAVKGLKTQAGSAFVSLSPPQAWPDEVFDGRRAYIFCLQDQAVSIELQKMMVRTSGKAWRELEIEDSDHSPFLSRIESLFKIVDDLAGDWN